ncbi:MAG TPA: hypothetical protein VKD72_25855 [Gemmataceae bacterium]|nr:hypothetical protein [Gemmataceae bacterium]
MIHRAAEDVRVEDPQSADGSHALPDLRQQVNRRHRERQEHSSQLLQRLPPVQPQEHLHHLAIEGVVTPLIHGDQPQQPRQHRVASLLDPLAQVAVVDPGGEFLHHRVDQHAVRAVLGQLPLLAEDHALQVDHLLVAAGARLEQPVAQHQRVLGLLLAPLRWNQTQPLLARIIGRALAM